MTLHEIPLKLGDWIWSLTSWTWVCVGENITATFVNRNQRKFLWYSPPEIKKKLHELDKSSRESSKEEPVPA